MLKVKALLFDVFGTVVDWRTGIAREVESIAKKNDISLDPFDFADAGEQNINQPWKRSERVEDLYNT